MKEIKQTFPIKGMHCASCVRVTERALKKVPGVSDAVVNLATEKAMVTYDPSLCEPQKLANAISETGYELETQVKDEDTEEKEKRQEWY